MPLVKFITACRPMPHISRREMHQYWDEHHLPLSLSVRRALHIYRKEHAYTVEDYLIHDELRGSGAEQPLGYDQVGVHWIDTDVAETAFMSEGGQQALRKLGVDERHMTDLTQSPSWFAEEFEVFERGPGRSVALPGGPFVKLYVGWYAKDGSSRDAALAAWRGDHAELVAKSADALALSRYVQNQNIYNPLIAHISKEMRGTIPEPFDGFDEYVWYRDDLVRALGTPEGKAAARAIVDSEAGFAERSSSPSWFSVERIIY